ncbi:glycosyl transferase family 2 [Candidatus Moduliflexus flocculans]|uniref:Glycosyl transferase family 2 n=1 Tax=Candidatus Moduliflexus flocculans TaxID=1499966 RepID=A0A0S6VX01_9BACT|nr:glycosyl transferase family 2 [Candidatus Moduliflexus flocculans]
MTDVAVIIVNWNTRELLRQCLASAYQQTSGIAFEVWVIDNASSDGSAEMVAQEFPQTRLIRNAENVGFAKANNQALRRASARYYLLLNSDTALRDNAIAQMVAFLDTQPTVGIAGTRLLNSDGSWQASFDNFPRTPLDMLRDKLNSSRRMRWENRLLCRDVSTNFAVDYLIGAVFMIRRETIEQIGLLDETFFMYAEDIDWCYRAAQAGWQAYYLGEFAVFHHNRGSSQKSPEQARQLQRLRDESLLRFYRKHHRWFVWGMMMAILALKL